jgi:hypothetical protein
MKLSLLILGSVFLVATSFAQKLSLHENKNSKDSVERCGPSFDILNNSSATVFSMFLKQSSGTPNFTYSAPVPFPISIPQQSGANWTFHAKMAATSTAAAVIVRDHYTHEVFGCDIAGPSEILDISFTAPLCNWIEIVFVNDLSVCN